MSDQAQLIEYQDDFDEIIFIDEKQNETKSLVKSLQKPNSVQEEKPFVMKKQPSQIKIDCFGLRPSEINLLESNDNFDTSLINSPQQYDKHHQQNDEIGMSIHMQNYQCKVNYFQQSSNSQMKYPHFQNQYNQHNKNINAIQQSIQLESEEKQFIEKLEPTLLFKQNTGKSQGNNSINSLDMDVPRPSVLNTLATDFDKSGQIVNITLKTNQKLIEQRKIEKFQIGKDNSLQITFYFNQEVKFVKIISQGYLDYMQKYFFSFFNILIPTHIPKITGSNKGISAYLSIYFEFIIKKYPCKLLEFLEKSNFKQEIKQNNNLQSKIYSYTNLIVSTFYSGLDVVQDAIKKFRGAESTNIRILQRLFSKQIQMAEKHHQIRLRIQSVIRQNNIHCSPYQNKQIQSKQYILMSLRWLVGFELTIQNIKDKQSKADTVQNQKLQMLLNDFLTIKKEQQYNKMLAISQKVKLIYKH